MSWPGGGRRREGAEQEKLLGEVAEEAGLGPIRRLLAQGVLDDMKLLDEEKELEAGALGGRQHRELLRLAVEREPHERAVDDEAVGLGDDADDGVLRREAAEGELGLVLCRWRLKVV